MVIHGTDDPLVPFRGGAATARATLGADLIAVSGMGHDLPRDVWPKVFEALEANAQRAAARQPA